MKDVEDIVEKYEVPKEYHDAVWEAYTEGTKRGFISGAISGFNELPKPTPPKSKRAE